MTKLHSSLEYKVAVQFSEGNINWREAASKLGIYSHEKLDAIMKQHQLAHPSLDNQPEES